MKAEEKWKINDNCSESQSAIDCDDCPFRYKRFAIRTHKTGQIVKNGPAVARCMNVWEPPAIKWTQPEKEKIDTHTVRKLFLCDKIKSAVHRLRHCKHSNGRRRAKINNLKGWKRDEISKRNVDGGDRCKANLSKWAKRKRGRKTASFLCFRTVFGHKKRKVLRQMFFQKLPLKAFVGGKSRQRDKKGGEAWKYFVKLWGEKAFEEKRRSIYWKSHTPWKQIHTSVVRKMVCCVRVSVGLQSNSNTNKDEINCSCSHVHPIWRLCTAIDVSRTPTVGETEEEIWLAWNFISAWLQFMRCWWTLLKVFQTYENLVIDVTN